MEKTLSKNRSDNPKLKARSRTGGRLALYLEYYQGYTMETGPDGKRKIKASRRRDFMDLYLYEKPKNNLEKEHNRVTLREANRARVMKENEILNGRHGYTLGAKRGDFHRYYKEYMEKYTKKDLRNVQLAYRRFCDFLERDYPQYTQILRPENMDREMMARFVDYLQSRSRGTGARSLFARFKKVVKDAAQNDFFAKNPCEGVVCKYDDSTILKDILSEEEIRRLASTRWPQENGEIRRAFIFSLYTGTRFCDVRGLTFRNIDYSNRRLVFEQNKTRGHSRNSRIDNPLNDHIFEIVGNPDESPDEKIFRLPSLEYCNRYLKEWTARAGIDKHITWHCARHTFGTLIQAKTGNINTVKNLLGHSSVQHTQKYVRAADEQGREAVDMLPDIEL